MSRGISLSILLLTLSLPAQAAAPPYYPVQGVLTDPAGAPIDDNVTMGFALYESETATETLWSEQQVVSVEDGVFITYLGYVEPLYAPFFMDNMNLWLGITVGQDDEMSRVYLGSVPFAAYAERCGAAPIHSHQPQDVPGAVSGPQACPEGQSITGFSGNGMALCAVISGGGTYTGADFALSGNTCPPNMGMVGVDVAGYPVCAAAGNYSGADFALSGQDCPSGTVAVGITYSGFLVCEPGGGGGGGIEGSGTNHRIPKFTSSDTLDDSIITESSNKIGINDTSPSRTLDVKGDLQVTGDFYWGGSKFSSSSCLVVGGTSCSSACSAHGMSCYKAFRIDGDSTSESCSQSGFKFCCCKN